MHVFIVYQELFESLEEKLEEDLIEALAALSLSKAMYDARTLDQAMRVSRWLNLFNQFDVFRSRDEIPT